LLASLDESGQQTPIVVVAAEGQADRYVVIDGYKRIAALAQLGRDTVEAVVWPMSEAAAVLLDRSLHLTEHETALEVGWLLAEMEQRFGYSLEELARRFDRSVAWVSRRLALAQLPHFGERNAEKKGFTHFLVTILTRSSGRDQVLRGGTTLEPMPSIW
jgi:ParB/RepB/Spo0J family partition protein